MRKKYLWAPKEPVHKVIGFDKPRKEKLLNYKTSSFDLDPNREKLYGSTYTERQQRILSGDLPWEVVRINEISLIANKAKQLGDIETYEKALALRELKKNQGAYIPQMTLEEAKDILKRLTPDNE